jgi:hypothetical protein
MLARVEHVTKHKDDHTPDPSGGRAAERLREFERARGLEPDQLKKGTKSAQRGVGESTETPARDRAAPPKPKKDDAGKA